MRHAKHIFFDISSIIFYNSSLMSKINAAFRRNAATAQMKRLKFRQVFRESRL